MGNHSSNSPFPSPARRPDKPSPRSRPASPHLRRRWLAYFSSFVLLLGSAGIMAGGTWVATRWLLDKEAPEWIERWFPRDRTLSVRGLSNPETLAEIKLKLKQNNYLAGSTVSLGSNRSFLDGRTQVTEFLLPVLRQQVTCQPNCNEIAELRLYQAVPQHKGDKVQEKRFFQIRQMAIANLEEAVIVASLIESDNLGASRSMAFTQLEPFDHNVPSKGVWLNLSGTTQRQNLAIAYGRVLIYNPERYHLSSLLEWVSPAGQLPTWEKSDRSLPDLVVNQSQGLEPHYKIYRVEQSPFLPNPTRLQAVSLLEPALDQQSYKTALLLARSGLWSTSLRWMQSFKQSRAPRSRQWNTTTEAQLRLIRKHAAIARTQAEQVWASASQQVLANLLDGRWKPALQVLQSSEDAASEIATLLQADNGRLHSRIQVALRLEPTNRDIKAWATLLIAAKYKREAAIAWLKRQPKTSEADIDYISSFLLKI